MNGEEERDVHDGEEQVNGGEERGVHDGRNESWMAGRNGT